MYYNHNPYGWNVHPWYNPMPCSCPQAIQIQNNQRNLELINVVKIQRDLKGTGIRVAVIDTGYNGIHRSKLKRTLNLIDGSTNISRKSSHGTDVTDIILDVAPAASIYAYKVYDDEDIVKEEQQIVIREDVIEKEIQRFLTALTDAQDQGVQIINMSLSNWLLFYEPEGYPVSKKVDELSKKGIVVVCTAGNKGCDSCIGSPGNSPYVITVGATTEDGTQVAPDSSRGPVTNTAEIKPDVVAPGTYQSRGSQAIVQGTSYAAPYVTGAIALIKQKLPLWGPIEMKSALATTATQLKVEDNIVSPLTQGSGLINAREALFNNTIFDPVHLTFRLPDLSSALSQKIQISNRSDQDQDYRIQFDWDDTRDLSGFTIDTRVDIHVRGEESVDFRIQAMADPNWLPQPGQRNRSTGTIYFKTEDQTWHVPIFVEVDAPKIIDLHEFKFKTKRLTFVVNYEDVLLSIKIGQLFQGKPSLMKEIERPLGKGDWNLNVSEMTQNIPEKLFERNLGRQLTTDTVFFMDLTAHIKGTNYSQNLVAFTFQFDYGQMKFQNVQFKEIERPSSPQIEY